MAVLWNYSVATGVPVDLISNGKGSSFFIYYNASHFYLESVNESNGNINWVVDLGTSPIYSGWESKLDFNSDGNLLLSFNGNVNTYSYSNGAILISPPIEIGYGNYALTDTGLIQTIGVSNSAYYSNVVLPNNTAKVAFNNGISTVYKDISALSVGSLVGPNSLYTNDLYKNTNGDFIVQTSPAGTPALFVAYSDAATNIYRKTDYASENWSYWSPKSYSFNAPSSGYYLITNTLGSQVNIANTEYSLAPGISLIKINAPGNFNISVSTVSTSGLYIPAGSFYQVYAQKVDFLSYNSGGTYLLDYQNDGTFNWALNIDSTKTVNKIIPSTNGDFYVIGSIAVVGGSDLFIQKYSSQGVQIWAKTFDLGKYDGIFDGAVTNSGDYLIVAGQVQTDVGTGVAGTPKYLNGFWMQVNASTGAAPAPNYFEQSSTIDSSIREVYKTPSGLEIAYTQQPSSTTAYAAYIETITLPNTSPTGSVTITGTKTQGQPLTASNNIADADGLGAITYQWKAAGVNISGATSSTYTLTQAEVGKAISVVASYIDLQGASESLTSASTSSVVNINDLPTGTVTITGTVTQGQTLTATNSLVDVDGLGTIAYTWKANGTTIGTGATYTLTQAEAGKTITATASYTDLLGTPESVESVNSVTFGAVIALPQVGINVSPASVNESGSTNLVYTFTRTGDTSASLTVNFSVSGTASASDYTSSLDLNLNGTKSWTKLLGTTSYDGALALTTGLDGAIYVSGTTSGNLSGEQFSGASDAFTTKYLPDGTKSWTKLLGTTSADGARALTTGLDGAIYVGGYTNYVNGYPNVSFDGQFNAGGYDAFITKYLADGTKSWTKLLGASSNQNANALTTGTDGSIYLAGDTAGSLDGQAFSGGGTDAFVTKYLADGTKSWTKLFGTSSDDYAYALTTGLDGAIYVSGITSGNLNGQINSGGGFATFVTKYLADGTKSWTKLLDSGPSGEAKSLTTGTDGAIYVCGLTYNNLDGQSNSGGIDAFITKYLPDGTKSWTKLLGTSSDDAAYGLTTGIDGAIYVTGYTSGNLDGQTNSGPADAFITKYLPDGTKSWTKLLGTISNDVSYGITTGIDGAIYICGNTPGNLDGQTNSGINDAFVAKYLVSPQVTFAAGSSAATLVIYPTSDSIVEGNETVIISVVQSAGYDLGATSIATGTIVDTNNLPTGTVTITGSAKQGQTLTAANTLADVDGLGSISYTWKANGATIGSGTTYTLTQAEQGKTITASASYTDLLGTPESVTSTATGVVIALPQVVVSVPPSSVNESGSTNLVYTFTRTGDTSASLTVNLNVSGTASASDYTSSLDLNLNGTKSWTKLLGSNSSDYASALTTGTDGAIYLSGSTYGNLDGQTNSGGYDAFITKYLPDGAKSWTKLLGSNSDDFASALTTGTDGSIYIIGTTLTLGSFDGQTSINSPEAFITKYLPDGTKSWTKLLGSNSSDYASALTTGTDGAIYVSGKTWGSFDGQTNSGLTDAFITKYMPDGTKSWTKFLGSNAYEWTSALTTGTDGAIYISGFTNGNLDGQASNGSYDAFVTKYLPDGTKSWTKLLGTSGDEHAYALTTGTDGAIYVGGSTSGNLDGQTNSGGLDAFITKYMPDGTKSWTKLLGSNFSNDAYALTTGTDGAIYVSGYTYGNFDGQTSSGGQEAFITKFLPDGTKSWTKFLGTSGDENAYALTTGTDGAIYFGGGTSGNLDGQTNSGLTDAFITKYLVSPQITFAASSSTATLLIDPTPDLILEGNETVVVSIAQSTAYDLGATSTATGTIVDTIRFLGGSGNDTFVGNQVTDTRNNFVGAGGNDDITGNSRADVAEYSGNLSDYTIAASNGLITIADSRTGSSYDGTDTLRGINLLKYGDGMEFVGLAAQRVALTGSELNHTMQVTENKLYSGTNAAEKFVIGSNVSSMILAGEGDTVHLSGSFTDYTYAARGSELQITKGDFMTTVNLAGNVSIETDLGHGLNAKLDFTQATPRVMLDTQLVSVGSIDATLLNTHAVL